MRSGAARLTRYPWLAPPGGTQAAADAVAPPAIVAQVPRVTLSPAEAARALGVSVGTLRSWERQGCGPPSFVAPGGRLRLYPVALLAQWAAEQAGRGDSDGDRVKRS